MYFVGEEEEEEEGEYVVKIQCKFWNEQFEYHFYSMQYKCPVQLKLKQNIV